MATQPEFLPAAPGTFANAIDPKTGAVSHHVVLGFQKGAAVLYPDPPKGHAVVIEVGRHTMYVTSLGRECGDINHAKQLLGAPV